MSTDILNAIRRSPDVTKNPLYPHVLAVDQKGSHESIQVLERHKTQGQFVLLWIEAVATFLVEYGRIPNNIGDAGWWGRELDDAVAAGLVERKPNVGTGASMLAPSRRGSVLERGSKVVAQDAVPALSAHVSAPALAAPVVLRAPAVPVIVAPNNAGTPAGAPADTLAPTAARPVPVERGRSVSPASAAELVAHDLAPRSGRAGAPHPELVRIVAGLPLPTPGSVSGDSHPVGKWAATVRTMPAPDKFLARWTALCLLLPPEPEALEVLVAFLDAVLRGPHDPATLPDPWSTFDVLAKELGRPDASPPVVDDATNLNPPQEPNR